VKALSIRQPWAWAILHAGKDIENRDWRPRNPGLRFRGEFLIHASATMSRYEYEDCLATLHAISVKRQFKAGLTLPAFPNLLRGGIVGVAEIVDVVSASASPWFFGPVGLVIRNARPLPFRPLKGQLGFFEIANEPAPAEVPFQ